MTEQPTVPEAQPNPYLDAQRVWKTHTGHILSMAQTWQVVGILGLMMGVCGVGGAIYTAQQSKFIPYIVEVDKSGHVIAVGRAEKGVTVDARMIRATLATFINDARLVTPDVALQRAAIFRLYAHLGPQDVATTKMHQWLNSAEEVNPFKRATREMVSIEIRSVLQQTPDSWQVEWRERVRDRQGVVKKQYTMRALLTVYCQAPKAATTEEQLHRNPLGIYVRDFDWAQQSEGQTP